MSRSVRHYQGLDHGFQHKMRKEFDRKVRHKANRDFESDEFLVSQKCHKTNRFDGGCFTDESIEWQRSRKPKGYKVERVIHKLKAK